MSAPDLSQAPPVRESNNAPTIYADGYHGVVVGSGVVKLNLIEDLYDAATGVPFRRLVGRLVVPIPTLLQMHQALGTLIADMEKDGLVRRGEVQTDVPPTS